MYTRKLGKTGIEVSEIGFGVWEGDIRKNWPKQLSFVESLATEPLEVN